MSWGRGGEARLRSIKQTEKAPPFGGACIKYFVSENYSALFFAALAFGAFSSPSFFAAAFFAGFASATGSAATAASTTGASTALGASVFLVSFLGAENDFFNSSMSTFLMTGVAVRCFIEKVLVADTALFFWPLRFNLVTPMGFSLFRNGAQI